MRAAGPVQLPGVLNGKAALVTGGGRGIGRGIALALAAAGAAVAVCGRSPEETVNAAWVSGPLACLRLMRLCHPYLKGGGSVVNVSSGSSLSPDQPLRGVYAATKASVNAISRAAAVEWGPDGRQISAGWSLFSAGRMPPS